MTFLDVIEMVCDWWGARRGYNDSRMTWQESVAMNLKSKGKYLSEQQIWLVHEVAAFLSEVGQPGDPIPLSDQPEPSATENIGVSHKMPTVRDTARLLDLKAKIEALSPSNRLRLCAELLDKGEYEIVETLAGNVLDELRALRLLRKSHERPTNT